MDAGTRPEDSERDERIRDLKCRLHDVSAREQLMMMGARAAEVHFPEFPELGRWMGGEKGFL